MVEIELVCANSDALGEEEAVSRYKRYRQLQDQFPDRVVMLRPRSDEAFSFAPSQLTYEQAMSLYPDWVPNAKDYWEASVHVHPDELDEWRERLGSDIDIIHHVEVL
jgi:hypothetical protein